MAYRNKFPQLLKAREVRIIHCGFVAHGLGWAARRICSNYRENLHKNQPRRVPKPSDHGPQGINRCAVVAGGVWRGLVEVGVGVMGLFMPVNLAPTAKTQDLGVFYGSSPRRICL